VISVIERVHAFNRSHLLEQSVVESMFADYSSLETSGSLISPAAKTPIMKPFA